MESIGINKRSDLFAVIDLVDGLNPVPLPLVTQRNVDGIDFLMEIELQTNYRLSDLCKRRYTPINQWKNMLGIYIIHQLLSDLLINKIL